jgi:hypothetical protein
VILERSAVENVLPGGRPSSNALAVKSVSGSASMYTVSRMILKLSVVDTSTSMRAGRSARAHTTPEPMETSPDCTPCVIIGRSAARLMKGLPIPVAIAAVEAKPVSKRRRVSGSPFRNKTVMWPPPLSS